MSRFETLLKTVVLGGLGLMFYSKISDGTLAFYINQRFAWLVFTAVLILAVLALTLVYRLRNQGHGHAFVEIEDAHEHQHRQHRLAWVGIAILAIPMLLGLTVPARPLGASAVNSRGIGLTAPNRPGSQAQPQLATSGPKNILDWLREFSHDADPAAVKGQAVDVIGFVYRDPRNAANQFWVSRFAISCCVADASAVGLLVQSDATGSLKNDSWVHVTGKLDVGEFAGEKVPVIIPVKIEPTDQPENPYLYP
jgi:putative membrane protein